MIDEITKLEAPIVAAFIGAFAAIATAIVTSIIGFTTVFIQIGRQGRNAIVANRENEALKRKVEIYERTLDTSKQATEATGALSSYLSRFKHDIDLWKAMTEGGHPWRPPTARYPEYRRLSEEATSAVISVMTMIEAWHIIEPKLDVFRDAFSLGLDGLMKVTFKGDNALIVSMPVDGREAEWRAPDQATHQRLKDRIEAETYQIDRLSNWVYDFQIEMQILLLSDLFSNRVERRDPPDQKMFCIRLDRHEEIRDRIEASDWGKQRAELEAEAWRRFS